MLDKKFINRDYISSELTGRIINCCFKVHNQLGPGFNEVIYQRALDLELRCAGVEAAREQWLNVRYFYQIIGKKRVDFLFKDCILEIKAKREFDPQDYIQLISYLKATKYPVGLLINFGSKKVEVKRFANTENQRHQ